MGQWGKGINRYRLTLDLRQEKLGSGKCKYFLKISYSGLVFWEACVGVKVSWFCFVLEKILCE
jgi:hypothetical protein